MRAKFSASIVIEVGKAIGQIYVQLLDFSRYQRRRMIALRRTRRITCYDKENPMLCPSYCLSLIKETFATHRATETRYSVIAINLSFKFVVVRQFFVYIIVSRIQLSSPLNKNSLFPISRRAYMTILFVPSTLIIFAVQFGVQE